MKVAFVVQRYGTEISGGAELHCRWIAERMNKYWDVEVLTTKASDYITWKDFYTENEEMINGIPVKRFSVQKPRNPERFGRIQNHILKHKHSKKDELKWLDEEGPLSISLLQYIKKHQDSYDYFFFFSYRYYHSYHGINLIPEKSILVPTAEHDPIIHLSVFKELFKKPCAVIYNSVEERDLIQSLSENQDITSDVIGVGSEIQTEASPERFKQKHNIDGDYLLYIGRIDENKGCKELFHYFLKFKREVHSDAKLVLIGSTVIRIPYHPDLFYLGFLSEEDKFSALAGTQALIMPSFYESLSMVTLEAWGMQKPVLANARCDVLKGQCLRSNAGLFYENYFEFKEALLLIISSAKLREEMGKNGRKFFESNYTWEVIEHKYLSIINRLEKKFQS
jgi:glycosyltransferase involved in cell wall biosynthesis